jgi:arylsulfatase A-like enzyme
MKTKRCRGTEFSHALAFTPRWAESALAAGPWTPRGRVRRLSATRHPQVWSRLKHQLLFSLLFLTAFGLLPASAPAPTDRPNVVIILADDLGYGDLGCYGHPTFKTPNIDRLAAAGARFTQFNCPASYCAPTRASLLTGRYPFRNGMTGNPAPDGQRREENTLHLPETEITLAQLLQRAGYATGMIGKWHLGHAKPEWLPTHRGFDEYLGIPYSNDMRPVQLIEGDQPVEYPVVQANLTQRYTARAIDFIKRNQSTNFFLYLAHAMPHKPLAASEAFYKRSGVGLYGDVMTELDWSVGQVLATLRELGLEENTLVIFTSDNGPYFGGSSGGLRGMKASSYEGGYRVPCIARWPGKIPAGHVNHSPAVMMDLYTTTLKAANLAPPLDRVIDGRDLMPQFTSDAPSPHEVILGQLGPRVATIRDTRWKLHVIPAPVSRSKEYKPGERWIDPRAPDGVTILAPYEQYQPSDYPGLSTGDAPAPLQLFDLQADPGEQHDVAAANPTIVARLRKLYDELLATEPPAPTS